MADRTHEYMLFGAEDTYDRLGFRYTEGKRVAWLYHPDSQHGTQVKELSLDEMQGLLRFLEEVVPIFESTQVDEVKG